MNMAKYKVQPNCQIENQFHQIILNLSITTYITAPEVKISIKIYC
jgi:hypothetical protein